MSSVIDLASAADLRRQQALDRLSLDAMPEDPVLDGLVRVAARALNCPVAMVNVVGTDSAWSVASTETPRAWMPRETAFCSTVVDRRRALVVDDLREHQRFARHPLVTGYPHIRFYAGLPIGDQDEVLGTLCVIDTEPRQLEPAARQTLEDLARAASHWLAARRERQERLELEALQRDRLQSLVALRTAELEQARSAAEAASEAKSAFLATMSHEIRTPMNGVVGLIELMDRSGLPPHQQELLHSARESAHTLLGLIDDILDFSKIESGRLDLEDKPFELRRLIESTADAWLGTAAQQQVALHVFVQPEVPRALMGDAVRLRQVVANLLGNAIKFSGSKTSVGGQVALRAFEHEGRLAIEVRDNGVGMTPDALARLFRPFEQADARTTRRFGGTGLGLAISQRLVKGMGGHIAVESRPGAGARFTVHLPLRSARAAQPLAADAEAEAAAPLAGVRCTWHGRRPDGLGDWGHYLEHAGATVVLSDPAEPAEPGTLGHWLVEREGLRGRVALRPGPQRGARPDSGGWLWLDADALHRRALLQAVQRAIEPELRMPADTGESEPSCDLPGGCLPVLVAEDNPVNRLVIGRQLQRLGVPAVMVHDGDQALARWRAEGGRFSVLLTDLHMPGLDGDALCAAIRAEETAGRRLPIVALTANAVRGEAERAIACGMDDYLTKPVPLERLAAALRRWLPPGGPETVEEGGPSIAGRPDFDPEALTRAIGPDPDAQNEMRQIYLSTLSRAEGELREALRAGDWHRAGLTAHRIKSSSHAVGAYRLGHLFDAFESAARAGQTDRLTALVHRIAEAAAPVRQAFAAA
ncbi:ATP-binding protein [Hydrogenophaga crocea]|uniref:Sensory/regulatory protein RpfC n=1 Tax=Hydrogenophaga crocea TaxID=2716225 RepID=A0A6G8IJH1_9BURK|nr:ATP-binding protein [Hydrogenophaga crocea]QIM53357.1 response regulator [Hydrogenophaga crocea]